MSKELTPEQASAYQMLLERHGRYVQQIKFWTPAEAKWERESFERARAYAAAKGVDVSGFGDERYAKILPVVAQKKRRSW